MKAKTVEAPLKHQMTELVAKVYEQTDRIIQPMKPFIFIRTLPRSIKVGSIWLPQKQNKPNIEAVVLSVYKPYWEKVEEVDDVDGHHKDISVYNECDVKVGDHIILPHHCGLPDSFLDDREYRFIREDDAIGVLHYREKDWLRDELYELTGDDTYLLSIDVLLQKYDVIPKDMNPQTTSGK